MLVYLGILCPCFFFHCYFQFILISFEYFHGEGRIVVCYFEISKNTVFTMQILAEHSWTAQDYYIVR